MTIDIDIYCKKEPKIRELVRPLNWEKVDFLEGYDMYKWVPKGCLNYVYVVMEKDSPKIYSFSYDKETIEDIIEEAKEKGIFVPDDLLTKFKKDNYYINADQELAIILNKHTHLVDAFPFLKLEMGVAKFSQGTPLHSIGLEAKQHASAKTLKHMVGLATYLASSFNGIIYEDQTNKFGKPNPKELNKIGIETFMAVSKNFDGRGLKINPIGF